MSFCGFFGFSRLSLFAAYSLSLFCLQLFYYQYTSVLPLSKFWLGCVYLPAPSNTLLFGEDLICSNSVKHQKKTYLFSRQPWPAITTPDCIFHNTHLLSFPVACSYSSFTPRRVSQYLMIREGNNYVLGVFDEFDEFQGKFAFSSKKFTKCGKRDSFQCHFHILDGPCFYCISSGHDFAFFAAPISGLLGFIIED